MDRRLKFFGLLFSGAVFSAGPLYSQNLDDELQKAGFTHEQHKKDTADAPRADPLKGIMESLDEMPRDAMPRDALSMPQKQSPDFDSKQSTDFNAPPPVQAQAQVSKAKQLALNELSKIPERTRALRGAMQALNEELKRFDQELQQRGNDFDRYLRTLRGKVRTLTQTESSWVSQTEQLVMKKLTAHVQYLQNRAREIPSWQEQLTACEEAYSAVAKPLPGAEPDPAKAEKTCKKNLEAVDKLIKHRTAEIRATHQQQMSMVLDAQRKIDATAQASLSRSQR